MTESELIERLTGVVAMADVAKTPRDRKAARSGLLDLCGLAIALRRRVELLEQRKVPTYRGVWQANEIYRTTDLVTFGGSMWFCQRETMGKPSTNHDSWQLCVKSGRDGRPR